MSNPREHFRSLAWPLAIFACTVCIHRSLTSYFKSFITRVTDGPVSTSSKRCGRTTTNCGEVSDPDCTGYKYRILKETTGGKSELNNIIAIINPRSGGQKGESIIKKLNELNIKVFNLFDFYGKYESETMERFRELLRTTNGQTGLWKVDQKREILILCGGGDGSVSSMTRLVEKAAKGIKGIEITMCPLPLGTGNDLCRSLGWGHKNPSTSGWRLKRKLSEISKQFTSKKIVHIDKWRLRIKPRQSDGIKLPSGRVPPRTMFCYATFGYDAGIALEWETTRQKKPEKFTSQAINNWYYVAYGFQEYFSPSIKSISEFVKVEIDNKPIELPAQTKSLKIININSAASGVNFWGTAPAGMQQRPDDGLLEVCATSGVSHLLAIHCGVGNASRCGQGRVIKVTVLKPIPIQVDGEPWTQPPCEVIISMDKRVPFLLGPGHNSMKKGFSRFSISGKSFKHNRESSKRVKAQKLTNC